MFQKQKIVNGQSCLERRSKALDCNYLQVNRGSHNGEWQSQLYYLTVLGIIPTILISYIISYDPETHHQPTIDRSQRLLSLLDGIAEDATCRWTPKKTHLHGEGRNNGQPLDRQLWHVQYLWRNWNNIKSDESNSFCIFQKTGVSIFGSSEITDEAPRPIPNLFISFSYQILGY